MNNCYFCKEKDGIKIANIIVKNIGKQGEMCHVCFNFLFRLKGTQDKIQEWRK